MFSIRYSACHLLAHKLLDMKIGVPSVLWIIRLVHLVFYGYYACMLTKIPHLVKIGANVESCAMYSKVSPESQCFLRLFSLYLVVHERQQPNTPTVYFPDETGLIGLITDDDTPTTGNKYSRLCGLV